MCVFFSLQSAFTGAVVSAGGVARLITPFWSKFNLVAWLLPQRNFIVFEEFTIHVPLLVVAMVYH